MQTKICALQPFINFVWKKAGFSKGFSKGGAAWKNGGKNMKKKNLLLCLCMALVFTASTAVITSCGDPVDSSSSVQQQEDLGQDGTYYNTADDASELVLSEGDYTLTIGGETKTGKYSYDGNTFVFVDETTITNATYTEGVLVFTYNDVTYKFVEKVDYTVTYNVDGETASTQTVRNGKKATAPDAPSKENYAFVVAALFCAAVIGYVLYQNKNLVDVKKYEPNEDIIRLESKIDARLLSKLPSLVNVERCKSVEVPYFFASFIIRSSSVGIRKPFVSKP